MVACLVGGETYRRVLRTSVWLFMGSGMGGLIFRHLGHSFRHLVNLAKGWFGLRIGLVDSASTKYLKLGRLSPAAENPTNQRHTTGCSLVSF